MQTEETMKPNILHIAIAGIMGIVMIVSGFFISLLLLTSSIILLPFAMFKIRRLQRQFKENNDFMKDSTTSEGEILEGDYVVVKDVTIEKNDN